MKARIESRKDYEAEVYNDPIKLLKAIKQHALDYEDNRYEMSIIMNACLEFLLVDRKAKRLYRTIPEDSKWRNKILAP